MSSLSAILVGLLVGFVILLVSNPAQAVQGMRQILVGAFGHGMNGIGKVLYFATPIMMTGLSVGFAFKTGLFNIGASGQFIFGAFGAILIGIKFPQLGSVHWIVALLAAAAFGAIWALLPGILKAYRNVNEVISCIMMNYIGMYVVNYLVKETPSLFNQLKNESKAVASSAIIPKLGMDKIFPNSNANAGFIIAVVIAIVMYIVLNKTTFGYEVKAVGFNRDASKYAGINEKSSIIWSMVISGALAGIGGGLLYLAGSGKFIEVVDVLAAEGFTGMSVALLGLSNPIGILFSSLFIAYITEGGFYLQLLDFAPEIIDIIIAVIIYFSAFSLIIKTYMAKKQLKKEVKNANNVEVASITTDEPAPAENSLDATPKMAQVVGDAAPEAAEEESDHTEGGNE